MKTMKSPHNGQNGHHQKNLQTINAGECVEKREPSCTIGGNRNWYSHCGRQSGCCSVIHLCPTLCHPPGLKHARLPYPSPSPGVCSNWCPLSWWSQPSHPLSSPSPPAFNLSQHQGLFQWVGSLHQVAKVLELQLQHQSFQWIFMVDFP